MWISSSKRFSGAEEKLVCIGFGVFIWIAAGRESVDTHPFELVVEKILRTVTGHVGPRDEELAGELWCVVIVRLGKIVDHVS